MYQIVIIGAGYGGLMTALRLQHQPVHITLINANAAFTKRIRLHQIAAGQQIRSLNLHKFLAKTPIQFVQGYVREIRPKQKQVVLDNDIINYDILVVATGSHVDCNAISGIQEHAYTLDVSSVDQLRNQIAPNKRLLVIGGGFTGIEAAAEFAGKLDTWIVTQGTLGEGLPEAAKRYIRKSLLQKKVTLQENTRVHTIHHNHIDTTIGRIDFDLCLWAGGFRANQLAAKSGFQVNQQGQMLLRDTLQSVDDDHVFAVGDAGYVLMQNGKSLRMACATAMPMGVHVANNITRLLNGKPLLTFNFGYTTQCISLGRGDALIQFVNADDTPKSYLLTGLVGSIVKELICEYTIFSLHMEKWLPNSYHYPKGIRATNSIRKAENQII